MATGEIRRLMPKPTAEKQDATAGIIRFYHHSGSSGWNREAPWRLRNVARRAAIGAAPAVPCRRTSALAVQRVQDGLIGTAPRKQGATKRRQGSKNRPATSVGKPNRGVAGQRKMLTETSKGPER